jgi:excinuclease UvrABC helicase subunit UvrB
LHLRPRLAGGLLRHVAAARKRPAHQPQGHHPPLVEILYERNDTDFRRGTFRVRGDVIEVFPTYDETAYRIELFGDEIESLSQIDPLFGTVKQKYSRLPIYPKSHYVVQPERKAQAIDSILAELNSWVAELESKAAWSRRSAFTSAPASTSK